MLGIGKDNPPPLKAIILVTYKISTGDFRFDNIDVASNDEFGVLAKVLLKIKVIIKNMITAVNKNTDVFDEVSNIAAISQENSAATQEILAFTETIDIRND